MRAPMADDDDAELEAELERELMAQQQQGQQQSQDGGGEEEDGIPVMAERIGPYVPEDGAAGAPSGQQLANINELLQEIRRVDS